MRLNRFLAAAGLGSRRACEELIRDGRVTINGEICTNLATQVSANDFVKMNGKLVRPEKSFYVLLNKPPGYVCTSSDNLARQTIFDLLPRQWPRLFHVGRLDKDSEGLLILTNDGDLSLRLTHPRFKIEKEYEVVLERAFDFAERDKLLRGFSIEGGFAKIERLQKITATHLRIVLQQGLKRQIRLMFSALGYEVKHLCRTRIGRLSIEGLHPGNWRFLSEREIAALRGPELSSTKDRRAPRRASDKPARGRA